MAKSPGPGTGAPSSGSAGHKSLLDAIARLRAAINRLGNPAGRGGGGSAGFPGLGGSNATAWIGGFTRSFTKSLQSATANFQAAMNGATAKVASRFEKAFDRTIGQGIDLLGRGFTASARQARKAWANPVGYPVGLARAGWGFGGDFLSGWKHAARGGIPVGGLGAAWGQSAALGWQNFAGLARRKGRGAWKGFARGAKSFARGIGRRARYARIMANRAFRRTGSIGAGFGSGLRSAFGPGGRLGLNVIGELGPAIGLLVGAIRTMENNVERDNNGNRHLGHYSGVIGAAMNQLDLGDQVREIRLARSTEGSAATLARQVNRMHENNSGIDRLNAGISNRVNSAQASLVADLTRPWNLAADWANEKVNGSDPKGSLLSTAVQMPFRGAAATGGFFGALWGGSSVSEAIDAAQQAYEEQKKLQQGNIQPELDAWSRHIKEAQNLPPIRPGRTVKP